jgi:hypothetical protein
MHGKAGRAAGRPGSISARYYAERGRWIDRSVGEHSFTPARRSRWRCKWRILGTEDDDKACELRSEEEWNGWWGKPDGPDGRNAHLISSHTVAGWRWRSPGGGLIGEEQTRKLSWTISSSASSLLLFRISIDRSPHPRPRLLILFSLFRPEREGGSGSIGSPPAGRPGRTDERTAGVGGDRRGY